MSQAYFVYKITNNLNGHAYIGVSNDPQRRWKEHRYSARRDSVFPIHAAMRKHGIENFEMIVIYESTDKQHVFEEMENHFIWKFNTKKNGYNCTNGGTGSASERTSKDLSTETRSLRSTAAKRQHTDPISKAAHVKATTKQNQNPEKRRRIAEAARTRWANPGFKQKMKDKFESDEYKQKISNTSKGRRAIDWLLTNIATGEAQIIHNLETWATERRYDPRKLRRRV